MDAATEPLNILLVDDDDGDAKAVMRAFKKEKIKNNITRAYDGIEALEILRDSDKIKSPYILLVDINMPRMDGLQFIEAIRRDKQLQRSVIFMLTTSKSEEDQLKAYEHNVAGYIVKETAGRDFLNLVRMIDSYWKIIEIPK